MTRCFRCFRLPRSLRQQGTPSASDREPELTPPARSPRVTLVETDGPDQCQDSNDGVGSRRSLGLPAVESAGTYNVALPPPPCDASRNHNFREFGLPNTPLTGSGEINTCNASNIATSHVHQCAKNSHVLIQAVCDVDPWGSIADVLCLGSAR